MYVSQWSVDRKPTPSTRRPRIVKCSGRCCRVEAPERIARVWLGFVPGLDHGVVLIGCKELRRGHLPRRPADRHAASLSF